ncbi:MAG: hypothetical protein SWX82_23385 [Cyanobacteriota bacterium]|nr:hypothetical protein [Cyanobacteriota bacterium]
MVYSKKKHQAWEQDPSNAVPRNKHYRTMHDYYNAVPPIAFISWMR